MRDIDIVNQRPEREKLEIDSYSSLCVTEQRKELADLEFFEAGMVATYGRTKFPSHINLICALQGLINNQD